MISKRKDTALRKKEIISAASRLILKYGSEHVTVRRLAKEVGLSEGALYRHFKSKKDVLSFLVDDIEGTLVGDLEGLLSQGVEPLEILERVVDRVRSRKGVSFQVIAEIISLGDHNLNRNIQHAVNAYVASIRHVLLAGVESGSVSSELNLDAAALMYFGMMQGLVNIWSLSQYSFDLNEAFTPLWTIFHGVVGKGPNRVICRD